LFDDVRRKDSELHFYVFWLAHRRGKKKALMLQLRNFAPCFASDITLLINSLNSVKFVDEAPESISQSNLFPLTTI